MEKIKALRRRMLGRWRLFILRMGGANIRAGADFFCARHVYVTRKHKVRLGKNVFLGRYVHIASHLDVGDDVMIASQVSFVGGDHRVDGIGDVPMKDAGVEGWKKTVIHNNVWIGHGAIVMAGVTINSGAVVAAGTTVTKDVEENTIVSGVAGKILRKRKL